MKKKFLFMLSLLLTVIVCQKEDAPVSYILQKGDIFKNIRFPAFYRTSDKL